MRYIGNKQKLVDFIEKSIREKLGTLDDKIFCDLFAGTNTVAKHFKNKCKKVISNDLEKYSYILAKHYIENNQEKKYIEHFQKLNSLPPTTGIITQNFTPFAKCERMFFTIENGQKIDAIRTKIEEWYQSKIINSSDYFYFLASLLESADKHANTTGVYGAYLKRFSGRSSQTFVLQAAPIIIGGEGKSYNQNANSLVGKLKGDILYLDPPYNSRQYGSNYHILNYIVDYKPIEFSINKKNVESKTGLSNNYNKSKYSIKNEVENALEELLINSLHFPWIFLSYNDEGLLSGEKIKSMFEKYGKYSLTTHDHKRYTSNHGQNKRNSVVEQLHILKRT